MHTNVSWSPPEDINSSHFWAPLASVAKKIDIDINLTLWLSWVLTPLVVFFILPMFIMLFIYASSLILYIHRVHKRRLMLRLREAVNEWDVAKAGREIVSALWDAQVWVRFLNQTQFGIIFDTIFCNVT
jgi:hypothetical protein